MLLPKLSYREVAQQCRAIGESLGVVGLSPIFSIIRSSYVYKFYQSVYRKKCEILVKERSLEDVRKAWKQFFEVDDKMS